MTELSIDGSKLRAAMIKFVAGTGVIIVYILLLSFSWILLVAGAVMLITHVLPLFASGWIVAGAVLCLALWWIAFLISPYLLEEAGIELGARAVWCLLPVAPAVSLLFLLIHVLGGFAEDVSTLMRIAGLTLGALFWASAIINLVQLCL